MRHESHPSIQYNKNNLRDEGSFTFSQVGDKDISVKLKKLNSNKATGYDNIPPKLVKLGAECLAGPTAKLVNKSIETSTFPEILKLAEVTPFSRKMMPLIRKTIALLVYCRACLKCLKGLLLTS